jgi:hypothetical protein
MESKEFWDKLLESANKRMPKKYQLTMSEPDNENTNIPSGCEGRTFETVWKDGKRYGKGMYFEKKQLQDESLIEITAWHLAQSMEYCFRQVKNG